MKCLPMTLGIVAVSMLLTGVANASNVVQDGTFQEPIGVGFSGLTPWNDWTDAGITTHPFPDVLLGNYASLPNSPNGGADLFQRFNALLVGEYNLSFLVENQSPTSAELVFAVQQALGTPINVLFAAGTADEIDLPANSQFMLESLTFNIVSGLPFTPDELTFSNSYDAPIDPITNSVNPSGTIIDIGAVSLTDLGPVNCGAAPCYTPSPTPLPSTWIMLLSGFVGLGFFAYRAPTNNAAAMAAA